MSSVLLQQGRQIRSWAASTEALLTDGNVIIPLYSAHVEYCVQVLSSQFKEDSERLERAQRKARKVLKVWRTSPEESLKELSLFTSRAQGEPHYSI